MPRSHCTISKALRERFAEAAATADELFRALEQRPGVEVLRPPASTNVTRLRLRGADAASLPERLAARGISIRPPLAASAEAAEFELIVNETILRRPIAQTIADFESAIEWRMTAGPGPTAPRLTLRGPALI